MKNFLKKNILIQYFLCFFTVFFLQRIVFYFLFVSGDESKIGALAKAFNIGLRFDLRWAAIPVFLLTLISIFSYIKFLRKPVELVHKLSFFIFLIGGFIFYILDYIHNFYLATRFNANALEFMGNKDISLSMAWESYPIIRILLGIILFSFVVFKLSQKIHAHKTERSFKLLIFNFVFFLLIIYGKFSFYPLRWSDAFFSPSAKLGNFALNPISYFVNTYKYKDFKITKDKVKPFKQDIDSFFKVNNQGLSLARKTGKYSNKKYNIIVILLESIAFNKTSISNNPLDPTPELRKFQQISTSFTNFYTPTVATARSVFATITGIPDVTSRKMKSSSRNPSFVDQFVIWNQLKNYDRSYFIGGSASWGNIRGVLKNNIEELRLFEEGSYDDKRVDVWGISDKDLFKNAFTHIPQDKSFFSMIQTAGFHRPYTIPEDRGDFELVDIPEEKVKKYGFHSLAELNSIRLQDHAFGTFMKKFLSSPLKNNTIIAVYGDHGLPADKSEHTNKGMLYHKLVSFHVPCLIYTPWDTSPKVNDKVMSELDIGPTLAYLSGNDVKNTTLGKNIYNAHSGSEYAFLYSWDTNPTQTFLIGREYLYQKRDKQEYLFKYRAENFDEDLSNKETEVFSKMKQLGTGFWYYSNYLLLNNKKALYQ